MLYVWLLTFRFPHTDTAFATVIDALIVAMDVMQQQADKGEKRIVLFTSLTVEFTFHQSTHAAMFFLSIFILQTARAHSMTTMWMLLWLASSKWACTSKSCKQCCKVHPDNRI